MNPAEIRAIAYAIAAMCLVAFGIALGMHHVQAQWNVAKLAQDKALQAQLESIVTLTQQRDALQKQVDASHAQILANGAALTAGVSTSLRAVEAAIRSGPLSRTVGNSSGLQVGIPSNGVDPKLAASIESVNAAITSLADACVKVDADRTSIIALEPKPPH